MEKRPYSLGTLLILINYTYAKVRHEDEILYQHEGYRYNVGELETYEIALIVIGCLIVISLIVYYFYLRSLGKCSRVEAILCCCCCPKAGGGGGKAESRASSSTATGANSHPSSGRALVKASVGRKTCYLCAEKVPLPDWKDQRRHRKSCAHLYNARLSDMKQGFPCAVCSHPTLLWPRELGPYFYCDKGEACVGFKASGRIMELTNNGRNRYTCFPCDFNVCSDCCLGEEPRSPPYYRDTIDVTSHDDYIPIDRPRRAEDDDVNTTPGSSDNETSRIHKKKTSSPRSFPNLPPSYEDATNGSSKNTLV